MKKIYILYLLKMEDIERGINKYEYKKDHQKKTKEYNVGIGIIRVILSFIVFFNNNNNQKKKKNIFVYYIFIFLHFL